MKALGMWVCPCDGRRIFLNFPLCMVCLQQDVKLAKECVDANLTGFPAWIINGKKLDGEQSFDKLEAELASAAAPAAAALQR